MADGRITIDTKVDDSGAKRGVSNLQKTLSGASKKAESVGKNMTKYLTVPLVAVGGMALAAANDIDKAYKDIQIGTGATGDELQGLHDSFDEVFTSVPQGAQEVASVIADLNTLMGVSGDEAEVMAKKILDSARMNGLDSANLTRQASEALNRWGFEGEEAASKMDLVFKASQDTGTGMDELFSLMSRHGSTLEAFGMGFDESAYWIGEMEKAGFDVNGVIREMRSSLDKLAADGKDPAEAFANLSDEIKNAESSTKAAEIASEVFGSRARDVSDAVRSGKFDFEDLTGQIGDYENAIDKAAEENQTLADRFGILKNETQASLQPLGEIILDLAERAIPPLISAVQSIAEWFSSLSPVTQKVIFGLGVLLAIVGPLIAIFLKLLPIIKLIGSAIMLLTSPIGLVIAAIAALVAVVFIYWDEIKEFTIMVFTAIGDFFVGIWDWIKDTWNSSVEWLSNLISGAWNWIKETTENVWNAIKGFFSSIWEGIKDLFSFYIETYKKIISTAWEWIKNITSAIWEGIKAVFSAIWNSIKGVFDVYINTVKRIIKGAWDFIKRITENVWNGIKSFFDGLWDNLIKGVNKMKDLFIKAWDAVKNGVKAVVNPIIGFINAIISAMERMVNALGSAVNAIPSFDVPSWIPGIGGSTFGLPEIPKVSIPRIPSLDVGTDMVMNDGLAMIHKGEKIVPADVAGGGYSGDGKNNIHIKAIFRMNDQDFPAIVEMITEEQRWQGKPKNEFS